MSVRSVLIEGCAIVIVKTGVKHRNVYEHESRKHENGDDRGHPSTRDQTGSRKGDEITEVVRMSAVAEEPFRVDPAVILRKLFPLMPGVFRIGIDPGSAHK